MGDCAQRLLCGFLFCGLLAARFVSAEELDTEWEFALRIPTQSMADALAALSAQTHLRIDIQASLVKESLSKPVIGLYTADGALRALLADSDLRFKFLDSGSVAIMPRGGDEASHAVGGNAPYVAQLDVDSNSALPVDRSDNPIHLATGGDSVAAVADTARSDDNSQPNDQVLVTGTHIHGVVDVGTPTFSISREQIDASGYATLEELVATLPQNFGGYTPSGALATGVGAFDQLNPNNATSIDLRGLGPESTLTLVDGRRVAANTYGRVVDVSLIPLSMVDHIDIVTGGASAIYGSDAVAGVANVVLRHSYDGADTQVYYGGTRNGNDRLEFDQLFGHNFEQGGFVISYEYARDSAFNITRTDLYQPISIAGIGTVAQDLTPDDWRNSIFVTGEFSINEFIRFYADASYTHKKQQSFVDETLPAYFYEGKVQNSQVTSLYGSAGGAKFRLLGSWELDLSASASILENDYDTNSIDSFSGVTSRSSYFIGTRTATRSLNAIADGTLFEVAGVGIKAAFGGEARQEVFSNAPVGTTAGGVVPLAERKIYAAFGELNVPLVEHGTLAGLDSLEISLAARDDHYSDFGNAFDPQGSAVWKPFSTLAVRGSYAKAFRAPDLYTINLAPYEEIDPLTVMTPQNPAGTTFPALGEFGGNPNLRPETATTWSAGFDYQLPWAPDSARLSVSYFHVNYANRVTTPFPGGVPVNSSGYPTSVLNLNPTAAQVAYYASLGSVQNYTAFPWNGNPQTLLSQIPGLIIEDDRDQNIAVETYRGVDLAFNESFRIPIGTAQLGLNGTDTLSHKERITPLSPAMTLIDQVGRPVGLKLRADAGLTRGPFSGFVFVNYLNHYENQYSIPASTIASWTTFDASFRFDTSALGLTNALGGLSFTAAVQNIFDRDPPRFEQSLFGFLFDSANANPFGRVISVRLAKRW